MLPPSIDADSNAGTPRKCTTAAVWRRGLRHAARSPELVHHVFSILPLGQIAVVGLAHQADLGWVVVSSSAKGVVVMELEPSALRAAPAVLVDEPALAGIAPSNDTPHRRRDVARPRRCVGVFNGLSRILCLPIAFRFDPFELLGHRGLDNLCQVHVHQCLEALELVPELLACRELNFVALRREWLRLGSRRRGSGRNRFELRPDGVEGQALRVVRAAFGSPRERPASVPARQRAPRSGVWTCASLEPGAAPGSRR